MATLEMQRASAWTVRWLTWLSFCVSLLASPAAAQWQLGKDIPLSWYEDPTGQMSISGFQNLPARALQRQVRTHSLGYTRSALWVHFSLPSARFGNDSLWLQLGPNFLDHLTVYYRPAGSKTWVTRVAGDVSEHPSGDLYYRFPVFVLPRPPGGESLEVVVRVRSTSAVLLDASVWTPPAYLAHATATSAFWGFYFGLATLTTLLALLAAVRLRRRLAWAVCAFSLAYGLVACIQGYVGWLPFADAHLWQHYLTSVFTLLAYTCLLWVTTEALRLRDWRPRLYRLMLTTIGLSLLLLLSIPLDRYGQAIEIQGVVCVATALVLAFVGWRRWRNEEGGIMTLVLGLMPLLYVLSAILALLSLFGFIPYEPAIYGAWQYVVMVNMLTVLGWVVFVIRQEARELQEKQVLAQALEREREASFHQRQFIAVVSHEFRTPLAVIANALENLQLPSLNETQRRRRYRNMRRAADRLVQLTDNCLADSRLEAGGLLLQRGPVDLLSLIRSAADVVDRSEAHRWRLQLNGEPLGALDYRSLTIFADAAMLRIALSNLLDNAVKYSSSGTVDINVAIEGNDLRVSVRDHGWGIDPDAASLVFERYRRGPETVNAAGTAGTGLGLYVARQIVRAHGGELGLAWSSAQGSCFEITLPDDVLEDSR